MSHNIITATRIILGIFLFLIGISFVVPSQLPFSGNTTDILVALSIPMAILIGLIFMYWGYLLLADHTDRFPTIVAFLAFFGFWTLLVTASLDFMSIIPFYIGPSILIYVIWKHDHRHKHHPVKRAREFFGAHVQHLSDDELHHHIKH